MGPTYLVLFLSGSAALVVYEGKDEAEARAVHDRTYRDQRERDEAERAHPKCRACGHGYRCHFRGEIATPCVGLDGLEDPCRCSSYAPADVKPSVARVVLTTVRAEARLS